MKRAIIFDAGTLISLSMAGLLEVLEELKKNFDGYFLITPKVKEEIIDRPIKIKKFELEALRAKILFEKKVIELPESLGIDNKILRDKANEILEMSNSFFRGPQENVKIMHLGEASCLALSKMLNEKGIENIIGVDERITRMLVEKPENLKNLLNKKLHTSIKMNKQDFSYFKDFKVIRSTEIIYIAWKKGLIDLRDGEDVLDALLYALKFKGCSISSDEIEEIKRIK